MNVAGFLFCISGRKDSLLLHFTYSHLVSQDHLQLHVNLNSSEFFIKLLILLIIEEVFIMFYTCSFIIGSKHFNVKYTRKHLFQQDVLSIQWEKNVHFGFLALDIMTHMTSPLAGNEGSGQKNCFFWYPRPKQSFNPCSVGVAL